MQPRPRSGAALAVLCGLLLSGCATGEAPPRKPSDTPGSASGTTTVAPGKLSCSKPPALPSDVPSFSSPPSPSTVKGKKVTAVIRTTCGDIGLQLYADKAPQTVASFVHLATKSYWKDSPCHRLTTQGIYVLQCGDPTGKGQGGPGYTFGVENGPEDGSYPTGSLAMARTSDPNSNGGQFFIVHDDSRIDPVNGLYSVFGKVTSGLPLLKALAKAGVEGGAEDGPPAQPISILSVQITEKKA